MTVKTSTTVRLQAVVDVEVGCWEEGQTFKGMYDVATREGLQTLQGMIAEYNRHHNEKVRIVGPHKFIFVTTARDA